jgi:hypothetical protein
MYKFDFGLGAGYPVYFSCFTQSTHKILAERPLIEKKTWEVHFVRVPFSYELRCVRDTICDFPDTWGKWQSSALRSTNKLYPCQLWATLITHKTLKIMFRFPSICGSSQLLLHRWICLRGLRLGYLHLKKPDLFLTLRRTDSTLCIKQISIRHLYKCVAAALPTTFL